MTQLMQIPPEELTKKMGITDTQWYTVFKWVSTQQNHLDLYRNRFSFIWIDMDTYVFWRTHLTSTSLHLYTPTSICIYKYLQRIGYVKITFGLTFGLTVGLTVGMPQRADTTLCRRRTPRTKRFRSKGLLLCRKARRFVDSSMFVECCSA